MSLDEVWQRYRAEEGRVAVASPTSLSCLDDRLTTSSWGTPGGELGGEPKDRQLSSRGEFTVALAAYLQEKDLGALLAHLADSGAFSVFDPCRTATARARKLPLG